MLYNGLTMVYNRCNYTVCKVQDEIFEKLLATILHLMTDKLEN
jgi:hypothetical protein